MSRTIKLGQAQIALDDIGAGAPVLLLHGFPATRRLWFQVAPMIAAAGFRVLAPDLAGYGASEAVDSESVGMERQARWMFELLDVLGIGRAAVVAHDVGSAAAQLMVANAPERVRGLAVLDGVYAGEWAMDAIASIREWNPDDAHRIFKVLARRLAKGGPLREILAAYDGERGGSRLIRAARDLDPRQTEHLAAALSASGVPALVLWGERDDFLPVDTVARPLAKLLGAELLVLPGGHFTPVDCPREVADALCGFLRGLALQGDTASH
jgi:pimeloyl-ACP methyl ester carboxylesterase